MHYFSSYILFFIAISHRNQPMWSASLRGTINTPSFDSARIIFFFSIFRYTFLSMSYPFFSSIFTHLHAFFFSLFVLCNLYACRPASHVPPILHFAFTALFFFNTLPIFPFLHDHSRTIPTHPNMITNAVSRTCNDDCVYDPDITV